MPIGIYIEVENMSANTYAAINERLGAMDNPPGRTFHAAFHVGEQIHVFDVWESQADFENFAQHRLGPATAKIGLKTQPQVTFGEVHAIYAPNPA